jgi:FMN-dependent oxidoreductase (nitrilotriacetate monooxygenase family)
MSNMASHNRRMRLMAFPVSNGAHIAGWRYVPPTENRSHTMAFHRRTAELCERGLFDAIFFADAQGFRPIEGRDAFSRTDAPRLEPVTLLAALSQVTSRLGLVATMSTSYNEPYSAARRFATLDHLSGGRAGWNVVTSTTDNEAHNFGRESHFGHSERYARAHEFLDVCRKLWDSWDDDAIVADSETGRYFEPDRVHAVAHAGDHFRVAGPMTMPRAPQGHPVIVQAGASAAGQALAAATAEVVFSSSPTAEMAKRYYDSLKADVIATGRRADECLLLSAFQPIVAATEAEARDIAHELHQAIHPALAISLLQTALGNVIDLSGYDPDGPLPDVPETSRSQGIQQRVVEMARRDSLSIAEIARRIAAGRTAKTIAGTAEQVADEMAAWFTGHVCDGFIIASPYLPDSLEAFVTGVVPILQERGLFRTEYEGATLRENLGLARPASQYAGFPDRHVEPEIW